ncbi:glucan endo-1,3-beta-D-glucosidase, partial [Lecanoromycetidae sp. Uapishka_2]
MITSRIPTFLACLVAYQSSTAAASTSINYELSNNTKPHIHSIQLGFNYAATLIEGSTFASQFSSASSLSGTNGAFKSARLYSMINSTTGGLISAIEDAITTNTTLLLGLFASQGDANFTKETTALDTAITNYGTRFTDLIYAISVGSEDLYRTSDNGADGIGDSVANIQKYIGWTRQLLAKHSLSKPVGHVDTWEMWLDQRYGQQLLPNVDFVGMDNYPYWEYVAENQSTSNMTGTYEQVVAAVKGKPVWITETGWPVNAPANSTDVAKPGLAEASQYWQSVGCEWAFGKINTWWYIYNDLQAVEASTAKPKPPSFGIAASPSDTCGLFDLACPAGAAINPTSVSAASATVSGTCSASYAKASKVIGSASVSGRGSVVRALGFGVMILIARGLLFD